MWSSRARMLIGVLFLASIGEGSLYSHRNPVTNYHPFFSLFEDIDCIERPCPGRNVMTRGLPNIVDLNQIAEAEGESIMERKRSRQDVTHLADTSMSYGAEEYPKIINRLDSPCTCSLEVHLLDLGIQRYPRYLHDYRCYSSKCDDKDCREVPFKVWVLKQKNEGDVPVGHAPLVPGPIKEDYMFEPKTISVGCECNKPSI